MSILDVISGSISPRMYRQASMIQPFLLTTLSSQIKVMTADLSFPSTLPPFNVKFQGTNIENNKKDKNYESDPASLQNTRSSPETGGGHSYIL